MSQCTHNCNQGRNCTCADAARVCTYHIRALPLPEVTQEPVVYFKADQDGNLLWGEDCVSEDAMYDFDFEDGLKEVSVPLYRLLPDAEALRKDNEQLRSLLMLASESMTYNWHNNTSAGTDDDYALIQRIDAALKGGAA